MRQRRGPNAAGHGARARTATVSTETSVPQVSMVMRVSGGSLPGPRVLSPNRDFCQTEWRPVPPLVKLLGFSECQSRADAHPPTFRMAIEMCRPLFATKYLQAPERRGCRAPQRVPMHFSSVSQKASCSYSNSGHSWNTAELRMWALARLLRRVRSCFAARSPPARWPSVQVPQKTTYSIFASVACNGQRPSASPASHAFVDTLVPFQQFVVEVFLQFYPLRHRLSGSPGQRGTTNAPP